MEEHYKNQNIMDSKKKKILIIAGVVAVVGAIIAIIMFKGKKTTTVVSPDAKTTTTTTSDGQVIVKDNITGATASTTPVTFTNPYTGVTEIAQTYAFSDIIGQNNHITLVYTPLITKFIAGDKITMVDGPTPGYPISILAVNDIINGQNLETNMSVAHVASAKKKSGTFKKYTI